MPLTNEDVLDHVRDAGNEMIARTGYTPTTVSANRWMTLVALADFEVRALCEALAESKDPVVVKVVESLDSILNHRDNGEVQDPGVDN